MTFWSSEWNYKIKALFLLTIGVRVIVFIIYYETHPGYYVPLEGPTYWNAGEDGYLQLANTFLKTSSFAYAPGLPPTNARPLLPSFLLALFVAWNPHSWYINLLFYNLLLWILMAIIFLRFVSHYISPKRQLISLLFLFLHPLFVLQVRTYTFLPLAILLFTCYFFTLYHLFQPHSQIKSLLKWHLLCAIFISLLILTHRSLILLPFVHIFLILLVKRKTSINLTKLLIAYLIPFLVMILLGIRNWYLYQKFFPIYSGAGIVYWMSEQNLYNVPDLEFIKYKEITGKELNALFYTTLNPEDDALLFQAALDTIVQDPIHFLDHFIKGLFLFWAPSDQGNLKMIFFAMHNLLLFLFIFYVYKKIKFNFYEYEIVFFLLLFFHWLIFGFFAANTSYCVFFLPSLFLILFKRLDEVSYISKKN